MLPAVDAILSRYQASTLRDYVAQLGRPGTSGFQCKQDFFTEMANYTRETLGSALGDAIAEDLREIPQVLTANHHGIDTFAQSTQSNLLFSMRKRADGSAARTVPVLACGSVPLNNLTYPRGLLIYANAEAPGAGDICRLPLFPDSYKRKLVSVAEPFTGEMLSRSRARAQKLVDDEKLIRSVDSALNTVFEDFADIAGAFPDYTRQATVANHRLWRRLFIQGFCAPELVYIELENIASRLLARDLFDPSTICHQLLFDPELRGRLIEDLDGKRGCWQYDKLLRRCSAAGATNVSGGTDSSLGTMFFWGVDAKGRQVPLCIVQDRSGKKVELRGVDDRGQAWTIPFTPEEIARGLQERRLLPSIFVSYLLIAIARGISCIGGYYQADYFPVMQKAVMEALHSGSGETVKTLHKGKSRPDLYLSGMQAIGFEADGRLLPAGPIEIIASGGFDAAQYDRIGEITVLQAHIASLYDIVMDVAPRNSDFCRAKKEITGLVHDEVGNKIIRISMD